MNARVVVEVRPKMYSQAFLSAKSKGWEIEFTLIKLTKSCSLDGKET